MANSGRTPAPWARRAYVRVVLPRLAVRRTVGLGDVVARVARALGVPPCAACRRRAAALNRWVVVSPRSPRTPSH